MNDSVLILDLDGTLADTARDLITVLNRTIATRNLAPVQMGDIGHLVGQGARAMIARAFALRQTPIDDDELDRLLATFIDEYSANIAENTVLYDGVLECMTAFETEGWRLAICTNKMEALAVELIGALGLATRFAAILGGNSGPYKKPDPRHLVATVERAGGSVSRAIMVGDTINDIAAARAGGMPSVAVTFGYSDQPATALGADLVIEHFDALRPAVAEKLLRTYHG